MREESDQQATDDGIITITDKELAEELKRLNKIDKEQLNRPGTKQITEMNWNGSFLKISGYAFINDTNVTHEDQVSKSLILQNTNEESCVYEFPVIDIKENKNMALEYQSEHKWAGFEVELNFSQMTQKAEPLPEGTYEAFIQVRVTDQDSSYKEALLPLGNISELLTNGFHSTKMEYFSAKRLLVYNLMATYNRKKKTLEIVSTKLKDINPAELEYQNVKSKQYKFMRKYVFKMLYMFFMLMPIKKNRVLFATDSRTELNGTLVLFMMK
ncbi:polyribitolphosphotransferase [Bacillus sp. JCM 19045]|nr:polyribitolphosphotransferase [Bacillus sp. JCM 19045]